MAYFKQKRKNAVFILSLASADRSIGTGILTADADAYESGTVLIDVAGKFIRAAEATDAQAAASKRAAFLRDRTFAETDTEVLARPHLASSTAPAASVLSVTRSCALLVRIWSGRSAARRLSRSRGFSVAR